MIENVPQINEKIPDISNPRVREEIGLIAVTYWGLVKEGENPEGLSLEEFKKMWAAAEPEPSDLDCA